MADQSISNPREVELESAIQRAIRKMGTGLHVHVSGGRVALSGVVGEFERKREIAAVVTGMPGVRKVVNNIRVMPGID